MGEQDEKKTNSVKDNSPNFLPQIDHEYSAFYVLNKAWHCYWDRCYGWDPYVNSLDLELIYSIPRRGIMVTVSPDGNTVYRIGGYGTSKKPLPKKASCMYVCMYVCLSLIHI